MKASKWTIQGRIDRGMSNAVNLSPDKLEKLKDKRVRQYKRLLCLYPKNSKAYRKIEKRLVALT